ncbi:DNA internalization-related competence protein ComEC/Rec2 [Bacillus sp. REN10]|uniref:DNA internalization-related competence protein ComEC/Rec2 n=1 Tax=Bacillus sp. REN10 TaxID=2782541 RepID=UPI00193BE379|nr:DNA internalization-related competence protein ComEC/Rec2 [Bacillus sp. REN10]
MRGTFIYVALFSLAGIIWALPSLGSVRLFVTALAFYLFLRLEESLKRMLLISAVLAFLVGQWHEKKHHSVYTGDEEVFRVSFTEEIEVDGDRLKATVQAASDEKLRLSYRFSSKEEADQWKRLLPGTMCEVSAELERPSEARNRHGFDYRKFLAHQHIFWQMKATRLSLSSCYQPKLSMKQQIFLWRAKGIDHIKETFPQSLQPTAAALLFGDRTLAEEEMTKAYQRLGIIHLLAISGLHVGLLTAFVYYLLIRIGITKERAQLILLMALPVYALLAGGSPPVVRACLMTILILFSIRFHRKFPPLDALSLSFLLVLLYDPYLLYQVGFQLSYLVSFSLILSSQSILAHPASFLGKMFVVTTVSQIAALPVMMYHFFELSIYSFVANLFFVPFYSFLLLPCLLVVYVVSFFFPPVLSFLPLLGEGLSRVDATAVELSTWPFAVVVTGRPSALFIVLLCFVCLMAFLYWERTKRLLPVCFLLVLAVGAQIMTQTYSSKGEVSFIDIGQGDATLIKLPFNQGNYLIDTGGLLPFHKEEWQKQRRDFTIGEDVLLPYFKSKGITRIDKLILTHSDYDHIGAAVELFPHMEIKEMIISPGSEVKPVMQQTIEQAKRFHVPVRYGIFQESWQTGEAAFQFLSPEDDQYEGNDDSLVLYAHIGGKKWLFTGDAEISAEQKMAERFSLDVDVVKLGHHGSKTSTSEEWMDETTPEYGIISVGRKNRYGHPHREIIQRLAGHQVKVWRTDLHGEITYTFHGKQGTFSVCIP